MSTTHTEQHDGRESSVVEPTETADAPRRPGEEGSMGVASTCSRKRRLEDEEQPEAEKNGDESPLTKVAKPNQTSDTNTPPLEDSALSLESSSNSDFLTTSILARTLLTTTASSSGATSTNHVASSPSSPTKTNSSLSFPISSSIEVINGSHNSLIESSTSSTAKLESMVQQLTEQPIRPITPFTLLPSPILDSLEELRSLSSGSMDDDLGYSSFLSTSGAASIDNNNGGKSSTLNCCNNGLRVPSGRTVTILSPIDADDDDDDEWTLLNSVTKFKTSDITTRTSASSLKTTATLMAVSILNDDDSQVITEDENGKSYFNLGASEMVTLARKNSTSSSSSSSGEEGSPKAWYDKAEAANNDDASSTSSSCDSISSEDLFNSCEDFDPSDDDDDEDDEDAEDERNYKQMRSNILHLSLCKLNMYRTQQCVEPSLHRSVLICNTLRHIEQEIRTEDEIRQDEAFLKSREKLPSFWPKTNHMHHQQQQQAQNNARQSRLEAQRQQQAALMSVSLTHGKPSASPVPNAGNGIQNPANAAPSYMSSPNPYTSMEPAPPSPPMFSSYDYNLLRPSQTPFHSISYDEYSSPLLDHQSINGNNLLPNATSSPTSILPKLTESLTLNSPPPSPSTSMTLFECDSAYGGSEDMDLSSYYFGTSITSSSGGSTCSSGSFDFPPTSTCSSSTAANNSPNGSASVNKDSKISDSSGPTPSTTAQSNIPLAPPPPSDISDIICSSIDTSLTTMTSSSNARNLLPSSSSSVEIELCSNRIISNEYSNSGTDNFENGKLEPTLIATTTTIWSSTNLKPLTPLQNNTNSGSLQQSFAQESSSQQCGIESRLTDYGLHGHHHGMMNGHAGHSPHHQHLLPMDSLISASYSIDS